jgi:hypothetical protein
VTTILGFVVFSKDNGSHMYGCDSPAPTCAECGFVVDRSIIDLSFRLGRRTFDVSATYDNCEVVSKRFAEEFAGLGAVFSELESEPGFLR